jgi:hypothetical protein
MRTDVGAIFCAADITGHDGRVALIPVGCGEVATTVNNAAVGTRPRLIAVPGTLHGQPGLGASDS